MYGNQPILEQPCNQNARTQMRASLFGYTLIDMVVLLVFLSIFGFTFPQPTPVETYKIEDVYAIKHILDNNPYQCINQHVVIGFETLEDVTCKVLLTYIQFNYNGYRFYEDKGL